MKVTFLVLATLYIFTVIFIGLFFIGANQDLTETGELKEKLNELQKEFETRKTEEVEEPEKIEEVETVEECQRNERYAKIEMTETELRDLAEIIYHEAHTESLEGQQAVAEVVFNRVIADNFPNTVHDVIFQKGQFTTAKFLSTVTPYENQYTAIHNALHSEPILPDDVVYFSQKGENNRVWGKIGNHVFCKQYIWG